MSKPAVCETPRKAILRAMREARKLGYFAKFGFKNDSNIAKDAVAEQGLTQYVYALKSSADTMGTRDFIYFYWAGEGQTLVELFRAQGLKVEWAGETRNTISVFTQFPA